MDYKAYKKGYRELRKCINIRVDAELLDRAKELKINVSKTLREALRKIVDDESLYLEFKKDKKPLKKKLEDSEK